MVKLLSHSTGPSYETLGQIHFINALNIRGIKAELYGDAKWPNGQCAFKQLSEFKPTQGDVIINDGLKIQSYFGLLNLGFSRYSHGRKKRVLNLLKYTLNFLVHPIWLVRNLKFILYRKNRHQSSVCLYKHNLTSTSDFCFRKLIEVQTEYYDAAKNQLVICEDIKAENNIHEKIARTQASVVILAGAIIEPLYFTEKIIPMINARTKNLQYVGLKSNFKNFAKTSATADKIISAWIQKINS